ncbi:MAG: adenosylcobinamide-GDP ribazoletransferase [Methylococcaceae bacterium]|nr:adenosylcobinamide-GDP ribazoletransferase [Methylococcaceae bacterium]
MLPLNCHRLQLALSFYTRLPSVGVLDYTQLPQSAIYLPVVGWLVGGVSALAFYLAVQVWTAVTATVIALAVAILLTGGLHEDGFADVCDGFGGGWGKSQILAIMKDSHIGVYALLGLLVLMALKLSLLTALPIAAVPGVMLAAHSISRLQPLSLMHCYPYARTGDSKASVAVYKPSRKELLYAAGLACLPLWLLPGLCSWAVIPVVVVNQCLGTYFYRHIGGYTGDCLGASQQIAELVFYLSVSALWKFI